ncbi:thermophilic serine proteinase [Kordia sp. SMS9]|uniref:S8 family serine peptidase n=1 Tax=Kordia sp. SMS9 TaxID=2282170 RepID=UPI000E0D8E4D|nr:S8 family serine peptidase [Kordia sp. SMS9]AXG69091.1 thermophilic serine proteinase [Kordia sp. SMS9]
MKSVKLGIILCCCIVVACTSSKSTLQKPQAITTTFVKKQPLTKAEKQNWHLKDIYTDSIPGISLEKAYDFLNDKKGDTIIVAVIDTGIGIDNEDFKGLIWVNKDEIPNNAVDDDQNGYIDDINGWNFLQTEVGGDYRYSHYACMRYIKKYDLLFKGKKSEEIPSRQKKAFKEYLRAIKTYEKEKKDVEDDIAAYKRIKNKFIEVDSLLTEYFPQKKYTFSQVDSLSNISSDSLLKTELRFMKYYLKNNINPKWADKRIQRELKELNTILNFSFNERAKQGDNINDLNDFPYGNNNVQGTEKVNHGTKVVSILAATRNNNMGIDGITNLVKILPLCAAPYGNEHDKDIALAIRYAVDNDAKIINMSIGKEFSMHPTWLKEAIQYAEKNNVLIVSSAGNKSYNLDVEFDYPDDYDENGEYAKNFIKVGASSYKADSTLVWLSSNYSQKNVDIFAPGHKIYCQSRKRTSYYSGTSYASPIVAGIAALIRSYYPNLSAVEVKEIILASGISFDVDVVQPYPYGEKQPKDKIPFSSMSKSGKIVNAYNALLMAEEVSKKKKRKK